VRFCDFLENDAPNFFQALGENTCLLQSALKSNVLGLLAYFRLCVYITTIELCFFLNDYVVLYQLTFSMS